MKRLHRIGATIMEVCVVVNATVAVVNVLLGNYGMAICACVMGIFCYFAGGICEHLTGGSDGEG